MKQKLPPSVTALSAAVYRPPYPFTVIHLRFLWDQKEIITAKELVQKLELNNVILTREAVKPPELNPERQ